MFETRMLLATFGPLADPPPLLTLGQASWRLAWLATITAATCLVAVAPTLFTRRSNR